MFEPGENEVIVGEAAAARSSPASTSARRMRWGAERVDGGRASSPPAARSAESEIWCDVGVLQPAYRRGNSFQSVYARLESPEAFDALQGRADHRPAARRQGAARERLSTPSSRRR